MLKSNKRLIRPLEILPEIFFKNKKYGTHYYNKSVNLIDNRTERFDFIYEDGNYIELENSNSYVEDVEKALNFLNNYEYLNLVTVSPTYKDVLDTIYYDNRYDKGELTTNITTKRVCLGHLETSRFEEILSKEISEYLFKMGGMVYNTIYKDEYKKKLYFYGIEFSEKEEIYKFIENGIQYMKLYSEVKPNSIFINDNLYQILFDEKINEFNYIRKSDKTIYGLTVWINPHSKDILLYNNTSENIDNSNNKFNKPTIVFTPLCLFSKKDGEINTNKYHHFYSIFDIGFFMYRNTFVIYCN